MPLETLPLQPVSGDSAITYSARQVRAHMLGNLFSREGVIDRDGGHMKVSQRGAGANFTVDVAIGRAAVFGDDQSDQGTYSINNTTTVTGVTIPGASTTTTRTHRVVLQVQDRLENSAFASGTYRSVVLVQTDTAAAAALPPSTIPLASVAVPANATSVTDGMITDLRPLATTGTPDRSGNWSLNTGNWSQADAGRPLTFRVSANGWVSLAGWVTRVGNTFTCAANAQYDENPTSRVPANMRPNTNRDFLGLTSLGPVHWLITPAGAMLMRFRDTTTLPQNGCWMSFDGCGYRVANT